MKNIMWKNAEAVIFDLDGTLVDSMWIWKSVDIEFLGERGIPFPDDLQSALDGMSFKETAVYMKERFELKESTEELMDIWNRMAYEKYRYETPLKQGVREFLEQLKKENKKIGIASSNSVFLVETVLKANEIFHLFDSIHTANEVAKGKPSPDIYLLVAEDLGVEPESCLIFEDIVHGIMAGKNAGMKTCAIYDNYSKHDDENKRKIADYYIENYFEII